MKSLKGRLLGWYLLSVLAIFGIFAGVTWHDLERELHHKTWQRDYPNHPDWKLHGSYSEAEIDDIMSEWVGLLLVWTVPFVVLITLVGWSMARNSVQPIAHLNTQLQDITPQTLERAVTLPEADREFQELLRHINELLGRLHGAFAELDAYASKVAHQLRTPLAILRLKVEQAGARIDPELAESLQEDLLQLARVVEQSLMAAKAEQGRMVVRRSRFNLAELVRDQLDDFRLLAEEAGRSILARLPTDAWVEADMGHVRQIFQSLLTNALKHGQGVIRVRVVSNRESAALSIMNVLGEPSDNELGLGLGLRVVRALARLQPEAAFQSHQAGRRFSARLRLHASPVTPRGASTPEPAGESQARPAG